MDVDDFDRGVVLEVLAKLCDVNVHGTGVEIVVVDPDGFEGIVTLEDFVDVSAEEAEEFGLLSGEFCDFVVEDKDLFLGVEGELANLIRSNLFAFLAAHTSEDSLNAEHELLHREGFCDIVVGAYLEALENVLFDCLGGEEDDRHFGVDGTYLLR